MRIRRTLQAFALILFFLFPALGASAQITTATPAVTTCANSTVGVPVLVSNLADVDSLALFLRYNISDMSYQNYASVDPQLMSGFLNMRQEAGGLLITWKGTTPVTLANDTLFVILFRTRENNITPQWDPVRSIYRNTGGNLLTSSFTNGEIRITPGFEVFIEVLNSTCAGQNKANVQARAEGGVAPYTYLWNGKPGIFDSIQTNLPAGNVDLKVTDVRGCVVDTTFNIPELPGPEVELITMPDTVYIQNPEVKFAFNDLSGSVKEWVWDFGDKSPYSRLRVVDHVYESAAGTDGNIVQFYRVTLTVINENGCETVIVKELPVREAKLRIPNVFTPNGDGTNETFVIINETKGKVPVSTEFKGMQLIVYNRWGSVVYQSDNYKHDWDGGRLADGVYFYYLKTFGHFKDEEYKGAVTILRGKK